MPASKPPSIARRAGLRLGLIRRDRFYSSGYDITAWGFIVACVGAALALVVAIILSMTTWVKAINEASCDEKADGNAIYGVVDGDFRVWSGRCYFALESGVTIPDHQLGQRKGQQRIDVRLKGG